MNDEAPGLRPSLPRPPRPDRSAPAPLHLGDRCPSCGQGRLDYNGLLDLECPLCRFVANSGGAFT
jgi:uncharacterized protein (DUF983 family)